MKLIKFNKVLSLLDKDQKKSGLLLISLMFIASIAELFGLGFVILIINSFLSIQNNFSIPFISSLNANLNSINSLLIILFIILQRCIVQPNRI